MTRKTIDFNNLLKRLNVTPFTSVIKDTYRKIFRLPSPTSKYSDRFTREPWRFKTDATDKERTDQDITQKKLLSNDGTTLSKGVYISNSATINVKKLVIGENSCLGSDTHIGGEIQIGSDCTVNSNVTIRGVVTIGNDVRIAAGAQILGFNHKWEDLERPIWKQGISFEGITIEDDVWIGANAVILDGVKIGAHAIIGAGAIVTKDVDSWMIVAGNPATVIKSRKYGPFEDTDLSENWNAFVEKVCMQMPTVLSRSLKNGVYYDFPGDVKKVRPFADAVELASMTNCELPGFQSSEMVNLLQSFQDKKTGLVPGPFNEDGFDHSNPRVRTMDYGQSSYSVMATGYALECLNSKLRYPVKVAYNLQSEDLLKKLNNLPWKNKAWQSGAWVDHFATACYFNKKHHNLPINLEVLSNWLTLNCDPKSGMWGEAAQDDWLHPVNGFYRLTRGSYAQFGWSLKNPNSVIDTVLLHAHNPLYFNKDKATACYVLDIIHPLYLSLKQSNYRRSEILAVARYWLKKVMEHWSDNEGMGFEMNKESMSRLQGTEMWLSIGWLCAHLLNLIDTNDEFRPKGIHRL